MPKIILPEIMDAMKNSVYSLTHEEKVKFLDQVLEKVNETCEHGKDLGLSLNIDMFQDYLSYGY